MPIMVVIENYVCLYDLKLNQNQVIAVHLAFEKWAETVLDSYLFGCPQDI